jgi:type IV pilus assembly protein PilO
MDTKEIQAAFDTFLDKKVVSLPNNIKLAIAAATFAVPVALFYFLYFSPQAKEIVVLTQGVATMQEELTTIKAKAAKLDEQEALMADFEAKFKEASLVIPDTKEISSLLTSISSQGSGAGLDLPSFVPGAERAKDFYAEIPISLAVTGTYHNVGYFLDTVSKLPRIVNVDKVSLGGAKLTDGELLIDAKLDLVTYKFIEPSDAPTGKPVTK